MSHLAQYAYSELVEAALGDPGDVGNVLSFVRALRADEREEIPVDALALLRSLALHRHYVPAYLGGELRSCEELLMLARVVARRDMNVAVSER